MSHSQIQKETAANDDLVEYIDLKRMSSLCPFPATSLVLQAWSGVTSTVHGRQQSEFHGSNVIAIPFAHFTYICSEGIFTVWQAIQ